MNEFWGKAFGYVERVLSPYQFWLVILCLSAVLIFLPLELKAELGLKNISETYKGFFVIALFTSILVFALKITNVIISAFKSRTKIDASNLNDEEKAVLCFFIKNQYQGMSLNEKHPTVISLINRNIIERPYSPIMFIGGDDFEYFSLTNTGKRKLQSSGFQKKLFDGLKQDKILSFVNSISRDTYSLHTPQTLS